jgi:hypothetical protein
MNGMVSLLYKHLHELGLQNELEQFHCIIHQQNWTGKAVEVKEILNDVASVCHVG